VCLCPGCLSAGGIEKKKSQKEKEEEEEEKSEKIQFQTHPKLAKIPIDPNQLIITNVSSVKIQRIQG